MGPGERRDAESISSEGGKGNEKAVRCPQSRRIDSRARERMREGDVAALALRTRSFERACGLRLDCRRYQGGRMDGWLDGWRG